MNINPLTTVIVRPERYLIKTNYFLGTVVKQYQRAKAKNKRLVIYFDSEFEIKTKKK